MTEQLRIMAGDCTATFEGSRECTQRGYVLTLVKPDDTVLVHDAGGYQPVAWLTRPGALTVEAEGDGFGLTARDGDRSLRVVCHAETGRATLPASAAGVPVGTCGDALLVRTDGDVVNLDTGERYPLPAGATVLEERCPDCGLPRMAVERGAAFELCIDDGCESLTDLARERFDREWSCPECGSPLRVFRPREGRILAGCTAAPDCETALPVPVGTVEAVCDCGLPVFETPSGRQCLDGDCRRHGPVDGE